MVYRLTGEPIHQRWQPHPRRLLEHWVFGVPLDWGWGSRKRGCLGHGFCCEHDSSLLSLVHHYPVRQCFSTFSLSFLLTFPFLSGPYYIYVVAKRVLAPKRVSCAPLSVRVKIPSRVQRSRAPLKGLMGSYPGKLFRYGQETTFVDISTLDLDDSLARKCFSFFLPQNASS